jgi:hypothetical protein
LAVQSTEADCARLHANARRVVRTRTTTSASRVSDKACLQACEWSRVCLHQTLE